MKVATYREATAPNGEPTQVGHFNAVWQSQEDVGAIVRSEDSIRRRRCSWASKDENKRLTSSAQKCLPSLTSEGGVGGRGRRRGGEEGGMIDVRSCDRINV